MLDVGFDQALVETAHALDLLQGLVAGLADMQPRQACYQAVDPWVDNPVVDTDLVAQGSHRFRVEGARPGHRQGLGQSWIPAEHGSAVQQVDRFSATEADDVAVARPGVRLGATGKPLGTVEDQARAGGSAQFAQFRQPVAQAEEDHGYHGQGFGADTPFQLFQGKTEGILFQIDQYRSGSGMYDRADQIGTAIGRENHFIPCSSELPAGGKGRGQRGGPGLVQGNRSFRQDLGIEMP